MGLQLLVWLLQRLCLLYNIWYSYKVTSRRPFASFYYLAAEPLHDARHRR